MSVTDAMVEAANDARTKALHSCDMDREYTQEEWDQFWRDGERAAIEAALAVQPTPTDGDVIVAVKRLRDAAFFYGRPPFEHAGDPREQVLDAEKSLLRKIAAREHQARRAALEQVREQVGEWYGSTTDDGEAEAYMRVGDYIAAELAKEAE